MIEFPISRSYLQLLSFGDKFWVWQGILQAGKLICPKSSERIAVKV
jgi:hypothetical protein